MTGPNFIDEIDCGSFFDHIDDLLDFPNDDVETGFTTNVDAINNSTNDFSSTSWPIQSESLPDSASVFSGSNNSSSGLSAELTVPYVDIVQLEWLSNLVEDSFSGGSLTINNQRDSSTKTSSPHQFQAASPVSVLESSSSCSGEKNISSCPENFIPGRCGRARSKRPRPQTFSPHSTIHLISTNSSISESASKFSLDSKNFAKSRPLIKIPKQVSSEQKKKKVKMSDPLALLEMNENHPPSSQLVRKCKHCEITKTPQWRAGPMGPKTLCNACGVRYKSGRLFPEYRPAASPTFVPSIHSNSHKKVVEMRNRIGEKAALGETEPEFIPNMNNNIPLEFI